MRKVPEIQPGEVFGRLTSIGPVTRKGRCIYVPVRCTCGKTKSVEQTSLRKGVSQSCGCLNAELTRDRSLVHGRTHTPIYNVWATMIQRCGNPNSESYANYGGRGVKVCERWADFKNFLADMGDKPFKTAQIERKDNNLGYSPENCVWATRVQQAQNKRNTVRHIFRGESRTLQEIAVLCGLAYGTLYQRLYVYGWDLEKSTSLKPNQKVTL